MRVPKGADRDFVAGAFVVKENKILFLKHKKYGFWIQPGGHIEERETPDEAALRETKEETGIEAEIVGEDKEFHDFLAVDLPKPFNINLHEIEEGHWHLDFQYICKKVGEESEGYEYNEEDIKWLSEKEIKSEKYEIPENVEESALKVLEIANH